MGFIKRLIFLGTVCMVGGLFPVSVQAQEKDNGCIGVTDPAELIRKGQTYLSNDNMEANYFGSDCILKAAMSDDPKGAFELAKLYRDGKGVLQSKIYAYKWGRYALYKGYKPSSEVEAFLQQIAEEVTPLEAQEISRVMREMVSEEYTKLEKEIMEEEKKEMDEKLAKLKKLDPEKASEIEAFFTGQDKEFDATQKEIAEAIEKELEEEGKTVPKKTTTGKNAKSPASKSRR